MILSQDEINGIVNVIRKQKVEVWVSITLLLPHFPRNNLLLFIQKRNRPYYYSDDSSDDDYYGLYGHRFGFRDMPDSDDMDSDDVDTDDDDTLVKSRDDYSTVALKVKACLDKVSQFIDAGDFEYVTYMTIIN